jgi:hypothetical protein
LWEEFGAGASIDGPADLRAELAPSGDGDLKALADAEVSAGLDPAAIVGQIDQDDAFPAAVAAMDDGIDLDLVAILASDPTMHPMHDFCPPNSLGCDREL